SMSTSDDWYDADVREMVAFTEREIFNEASPGGIDPEETDDNHDMLADQSRAEGIDGRLEDDTEGFASTMLSGPYQHRPVESGEIAQLERERDEARVVASQWEAAYREQYEAPVREQQLQAMREQITENLYNQYGHVFAGEPAQRDRFINDLVAAHMQ